MANVTIYGIHTDSMGTGSDEKRVKNAVKNSCLVGGLVAIFYFPFFIGCLIIPIDVHIFQRGGPTTNQVRLNSC